MAEEIQSTRIPRYIDDPEQFLWFDFDEVLIFMGSLGIGIIMELLIVSVIVGLAMAKALSKMKHGKPRGYLFHFLYWNGVISYNGLPQSHIREFIE